MKTEKMSFKNIKDVLSREEMKGIMAGSGGGSCGNCTVPGYTSVACYSGAGSGGSCSCLCLYRGLGCGC